MANRSERRSWDKYVKEAREVFAEVDLGDEVIRIHIPTSEQMENFTDAQDDLWKQVAVLMGEDNAAKLKVVAADAPVTALRSLITDVLVDLGMSDDLGE